jgi:hypothetical protein
MAGTALAAAPAGLLAAAHHPGPCGSEERRRNGEKRELVDRIRTRSPAVDISRGEIDAGEG